MTLAGPDMMLVWRVNSSALLTGNLEGKKVSINAKQYLDFQPSTDLKLITLMNVFNLF